MRRRQTMSIGTILNDFFERPYIAARIAESKLPETWRAIVGDHVANLTTSLRMENHILHVKMESSLLRHELFHQREALKAELNKRSGVKFVNSVIVR
ncbi:MAG: DUF721 domain-containing protein [Rikenellaceae bacterium]